MAWPMVGGVLRDHARRPERQVRVLIVLAHHATIDPLGRWLAHPGLAKIMQQANCSDRTARRTLDTLAEAKVIGKVGGTGRHHAQVWELVGVEPDWDNGGPSSGHHDDRRSTPATQMTAANQAPATQMTAASGGHFERAAATLGPSTGHPDDRPTDTDPTDRAPAPAPAREAAADDQPDWRRGPGPRAPGRPTPTPPTWTGPRAHPPPEMAHTGRAAIDTAVATARATHGDPPPRAGLSDDDRRAQALEQAAAARTADDRPPLTTEPDPEPEPSPPAEPDPEPEPGQADYEPDPGEPDPGPWPPEARDDEPW